MSKAQKIISIILGILAIAATIATIFIIVSNQKPKEPPTAETPTLDCQRTNGVISYQGETGKTALDLLKSICEVETKTSADETTITVTAIDGTPAPAPNYWALYINDQPALLSPNNLKTTETDTIKWQLETIGN